MTHDDIAALRQALAEHVRFNVFNHVTSYDRLEWQQAAQPERIARLLDALEAAQRVPLSRGLTPADRFEDAIREVGVVFACEWFGHAKYSDFTQETIRVLSERAALKDQA